MRPKSIFKAKSTLGLKPMQVLAQQIAGGHFEEIKLVLKNAVGSRARDLASKEVRALERVAEMTGYIGSVGEKSGVSSTLPNSASKLAVYCFCAPSFPLYSLEQNELELSFFEAGGRLYKLDSYKIYKPQDLDLLCLYISLKN